MLITSVNISGIMAMTATGTVTMTVKTTTTTIILCTITKDSKPVVKTLVGLLDHHSSQYQQLVNIEKKLKTKQYIKLK